MGDMISSCFYQLRCIRQVRNSVSQAVIKQLVHSFVISRLDYCNSVLAGLPNYLITQLQRVQNAAARLVLGLRPSDHVTPALRKLAASGGMHQRRVVVDEVQSVAAEHRQNRSIVVRSRSSSTFNSQQFTVCML